MTGGFEVKVLEPNRSLVLYLDTELVNGQQAKAKETDSTAEKPAISPTETPGLAMSGGFLGTASPEEFKVSWAFVLEPSGPGRTRVIERTRGWFGKGNAGSKMLMPVLGFGVFVMMQRQLRRPARSDRADGRPRACRARGRGRGADGHPRHERPDRRPGHGCAGDVLDLGDRRRPTRPG